MVVQFRVAASVLLIAVLTVSTSVVLVSASRDLTPCMLYIDPNGNDNTGTGTIGAPFASLPRALNASGTTPVPIGEDLTICFNTGVYVNGWNTTSANGVWTMPGNAAYNTLRIRSTMADPNTVTIVPRGRDKPAFLHTPDLTRVILMGAPPGMTSTFDSIIVTGNGALTWDADPTQVASPPLATLNPSTLPPVSSTSRVGGPDDFPFYLTNSLFTACTVQSPSIYAQTFPIFATNRGSGSMHITNVVWQNFVGGTTGAQSLAKFDSVDLDPNTDNHIHFTNITILSNAISYGFTINGGDIVIDSAVFQSNIVPSPGPYLFTMTASSLIVRNSTFLYNYNTGAMDIEIITAQGLPPPPQPLILAGNYFFDNTHWYTVDSSGYVFPSALSIDTAAQIPLVLMNNYWSCNSVQYPDQSFVFAPPIGVRVVGTGLVTPIVTGDTINTDCPVVCPTPVLAGQFSPCKLFGCVNCQSGYVPIANATSCRPTSDCMACPPGQFTADTASCLQCAVDSYSAQPASTACTACDHTQGLYQPSRGSTACMTCASGSIIVTVLEPAPVVSCTACGAGSYSGPFSAAATTCSTCAVGTYSAGPAVACTVCNTTLSYYQPATGQSSCLFCAGTVSADSLSCTPHNDGGDTCTSSFWKKSDCSVSGGGVAVIVILVLAVSGGVGVVCWKRGFNSAPSNAHTHASINDGSDMPTSGGSSSSSSNNSSRKPAKAKINQQPLLGAADQL